MRLLLKDALLETVTCWTIYMEVVNIKLVQKTFSKQIVLADRVTVRSKGNIEQSDPNQSSMFLKIDILTR